MQARGLLSQGCLEEFGCWEPGRLPAPLALQRTTPVSLCLSLESRLLITVPITLQTHLQSVQFQDEPQQRKLWRDPFWAKSSKV